MGMSETRPKKPIAWIRRRGLSVLARVSALCGIALVLAWGVGRWFNDDHLWSQMLFWIPTIVVVVLAWIALLFSAVYSKLSLRMGGVKLRPFLLVGALVVTGWLIAEWRPMNILNAIAPRSERSVRVAYWNLSVERRAVGAGGVVLDQEPDIAIVANIRSNEHREPLLKAMRTLAPSQSEGGAVHVLQRNAVSVSGRFPIRRWGVTTLERVTTRLVDWRSEWDTGRITFIEFDTGGELVDDVFVVWVVDLPSDPTMSRAGVMRAGANAVAAWQGPAFVPDEIGRWARQGAGDGAGALVAGFPEADLIIGDFNTPRGSRSVRELVGERRSTHAQAGVGSGGTWVRRAALWAIDQAFTGERVRATRSRTINPGMSEHRMLVVDLERR